MTKLKFGKLTYIAEKPYEFGKGIKIESNEEIPQELHKYYSPSENNFKAISNNNFYCAHPYQFNDLTDSNPLSFNFNNLNFEDYSPLFQDLIEEDKLKEMYEEEKKVGFSSFRHLFFSLWTQKIGTVCFTPNEMNNLMWGHYASDSGFQIKFDTSKLIDSINEINGQECLFFPINYIENKLHIDVNKYGFHIPLLVDFSTKVNHWEYENEWRIVISKNDMSVPHTIVTPHQKDYVGKDNRLIEYNPESILEIVFGMNFFNGKNIESITPISNTENHFLINNEPLAKFLEFISENLQEKTVHAGLFMDAEKSYIEGTAPMKRSIEKIEIKKITENTFSIIRNNPGLIRKF